MIPSLIFLLVACFSNFTLAVEYDDSYIRKCFRSYEPHPGEKNLIDNARELCLTSGHWKEVAIVCLLD